MHGLPPAVQLENATSSYPVPKVLNVSFHACHAFHAFQQFQKNRTTFGGEVEPMEFLVVMEDWERVFDGLGSARATLSGKTHARHD
jgi:hypothetical protein